MTKYEVGQTVKTVTGETAEIFRIQEFGTSIFYECWLTDGLSLGMKIIHQDKLIG